MATKKTTERKHHLAHELEQLIDRYDSAFLVAMDHVSSNQLHEIRKSLRGKAQVFCGKNTQLRRVLRVMEEAGRPQLAELRSKCTSNVGFVFTNHDLKTTRDLIGQSKLPAAAKAGAVAQKDLVLPKGITGLEPTTTPFLHALNIHSKITKGCIEFLHDVPLLKEGERVNASQAALLKKMGIEPFSYGLVVKWVWDKGSLFKPSVLDVTDPQIISAMQIGMSNVAAMSFSLGMPTMVSVPYAILYAFQTLLAVAAETEVSFKEAEQVKAYIADPAAFSFFTNPPRPDVNDTHQQDTEIVDSDTDGDSAGYESGGGMNTNLWGDTADDDY